MVIVKLTVVKETNITSTGGCNKAAGRQVWQDRDQFRYYLAAQLSSAHHSDTRVTQGSVTFSQFEHFLSTQSQCCGPKPTMAIE